MVGLSYVGTVTAACVASGGHNVWGLTSAPLRSPRSASAVARVAEPGLDALVARSAADGHVACDDVVHGHSRLG